MQTAIYLYRDAKATVSGVRTRPSGNGVSLQPANAKHGRLIKAGARLRSQLARTRAHDVAECMAVVTGTRPCK